ncbi:urease accessory protein UreE [Roseomonas sp. NAR14]|uniref:Urease accessory protein UreE n=1 Tax=Roseomonas acroporae TaxID=2937791 RepID=A0A9X1Y9T1_9PROT|nr:urease accessory protein UreE [Roseomonas acroporae]MCK8785030.1 urease accessory protein UreE [Roseomonas acroporae]
MNEANGSSETLPRATAVLQAGQWDMTRTLATDFVTLDYDDRHRRRRRFVGEAGLAFLLDLPEATVLREGDGLLLENGSVVAVRAAPEPLVEITAESPGHLLRLAWHLGNRHLPAELSPGRILIRDDHVIVAMLRGLGATLRAVQAPFNPEGGAYGEHNRSTHQHFRDPTHAPGHAHGHAHGHDHAHDHTHDHGHDHPHGHGHHHHHD